MLALSLMPTIMASKLGKQPGIIKYDIAKNCYTRLQAHPHLRAGCSPGSKSVAKMRFLETTRYEYPYTGLSTSSGIFSGSLSTRASHCVAPLKHLHPDVELHAEHISPSFCTKFKHLQGSSNAGAICMPAHLCIEACSGVHHPQR